MPISHFPLPLTFVGWSIWKFMKAPFFSLQI
jgi:hypothetical protein